MKNSAIALDVGRLIIRSVIVLCVIASVAKCYQIFIVSHQFEIFMNDDGLPTLEE